MAEDPTDPDNLSPLDTPVRSQEESSLGEAKDAQINRMAGCAKLGGCLLKIILLIAAAGFLYRCANEGGFGLRSRTDAVKVKATLKDLRMGFQYFDMEYKAFPIPPPPSAGDASIRSEGVVIQALIHKEDPFNPRDIKFLDVPYAKDGKGGLVGNGKASQLTDAWGEMYYLILDMNKDGKVIDPEEGSKTLDVPIAVYSSGPDRDPKTWADNIRSWE